MTSQAACASSGVAGRISSVCCWPAWDEKSIIAKVMFCVPVTKYIMFVIEAILAIALLPAPYKGTVAQACSHEIIGIRKKSAARAAGFRLLST